MILSTATITREMDVLLKEYMKGRNGFEELIDKGMHMNLSHVKHEFIQVADYDKLKPLKLLVKEFKTYAVKNNTSAIVFCNSV